MYTICSKLQLKYFQVSRILVLPQKWKGIMQFYTSIHPYGEDSSDPSWFCVALIWIGIINEIWQKGNSVKYCSSSHPRCQWWFILTVSHMVRIGLFVRTLMWSSLVNSEVECLVFIPLNLPFWKLLVSTLHPILLGSSLLFINLNTLY